MNLLKLTAPPEPAWEPDMGWRVLDPDGHVVDAGGKTIITATIEFGQLFGVDGDKVPLLGTGQER